jgi:hypothetical protein
MAGLRPAISLKRERKGRKGKPQRGEQGQLRARETLAKQWDAATRIDWSLDLDPENPQEIDDRLIPIYGSPHRSTHM